MEKGGSLFINNTKYAKIEITYNFFYINYAY